ncbi:MAG: GntR family transcriptional regulator [Pseudotabrizicola sp.]|uniref:GntR family transcriptional regulator n=1 Tax=Pseudotabrizicola sp. TaxID=2939647 RepID=UPI0027234FFA|nr:GntR family transcriptional regulator [Pseudotabrizicola sp.]MDO8883103.1 GntR family transcriptional regulator [Pseudotabrizicola sp.]MDP2081890.1 GntR family transcriptional regulator [Pseudotabrizicola sp.]MDZ7575962.1 GntR family transcriptional regulator [Pseudotabrizicola sp.]
MSSHGALPLYLQISELLIRDIAAGRLIDGERLPPEREMAAGLGIAVGTLRQALKTLTDKGLVERIQGSGNYIRAKADPTSVYALLRIELLSGGGLPTARVLSVDRLPKDPTLPEFGRSAEGHRIRRLRFLSGTVAAVEEIWLDGALVGRIGPEDLSESLYLFYRQRLNLWIARAEDRVGLGPLPDWAPSDFPHAQGTPLPKITRTTWGQDGQSVEASFTWYDPDRVAYVARLK